MQSKQSVNKCKQDDRLREILFPGVYSKNNLPKWVYVRNLDEYKAIGTHWIALYVNGNNVTYFDSFGVKHIPKEIKKFIGKKYF